MQRRTLWPVWTAAIVLVSLGLAGLSLARPTPPQAEQTPSSGTVAKAVGVIKAISGNTITLATDANPAVSVQIQDSTRIVRIAPGEKDLTNAVPMQLPDLQIGDRILVRGKPSDDGKSVIASSLLVMKATDIAAKQERDREDWQKRGVGGLVNAVDLSSGTITLSTGAGGDKKTAVHVSQDTIVRRYLPDSIKFDDAKPGTLGEIKSGDQLRARGTRSADGSELAAEEIVSGTFRNIAGTVVSTDSGNGTISVLDLATRKPVTLKINADSQLHALPPMVAQRIAMRLKGEPPKSVSGAPGASGSPSAVEKPGETFGHGTGEGSHPHGAQDFQQMLARMPAVNLADLQKGEAVMIVSTVGTASTQPTTITLLTGVEPILSASPDSSKAAMLLSPWNLGGAGGDAANGTTP